MKCCKICKEFKSFENFTTSNTTKDGYHIYCRVCHRLKNKESYNKNRNKTLQKRKIKYLDNHEENKQKRREHYYNNKGMYLHNYYLREDRIKQATPLWLTKEMKSQIREMYDLRKEISDKEGREYHIDHIVPIKGEYVCGLHVPWNLQILLGEDNLEKSNKHESDFSASE